MSKNEFVVICNENLVDPLIALENELVKQAISDDDIDALRKTLQEQF